MGRPCRHRSLRMIEHPAARPSARIPPSRGSRRMTWLLCSHVRATVDAATDGGDGHQARLVHLIGQRDRRRADVPPRRRLRPDVQPRLRRRRQRLGPAGRGRGARGVDDGGRQGQHDRVAVFPAPVRGAERSDRQHHEVGYRLDRGQALRRAQRRRLEGHADGPRRLRIGRPEHPRRLDHRAAVREELPTAGHRADRRREARRHRDDARPQAPRDPHGADVGQDVHQTRDPDAVSESGVVRQRSVRRSGRRADLLRNQRL